MHRGVPLSGDRHCLCGRLPRREHPSWNPGFDLQAPPTKGTLETNSLVVVVVDVVVVVEVAVVDLVVDVVVAWLTWLLTWLLTWKIIQETSISRLTRPAGKSMSTLSPADQSDPE